MEIDVCSTCNRMKPSHAECIYCMYPTIQWPDATITHHKADDPVNNPSHYGSGSIECIDYIQDFLTREEFIGYLRGNIAKYLHRWRYKNGLEDLLKAQWYLNKLIEVEEHE